MSLSSSLPDLIRILAVASFIWAGYRDYQTRRVPDRLWPPLLLLGGGLLIWEIASQWPLTTTTDMVFLVRVLLSVGLVVPLAYLSQRTGAMGVADRKAFVALAILFPTFPVYTIPGIGTLPLVEPSVGVFSLTILTNTMIIAAAYPLVLGAMNLFKQNLSWALFFARPVNTTSLNRRHGRLFQCLTETGHSQDGADLDAIRMYLRWRGLSLSDIRTGRHEALRTAPVTETYPPTDGAVQAERLESRSDPADGHSAAPDGGQLADTITDPWAAEQFLAEIDSSAYGTSASSLRGSLNLIATRDTVWVSPGIPLIVPMSLGLLVAILYGDLLFAALSAIGIV